MKRQHLAEMEASQAKTAALVADIKQQREEEEANVRELMRQLEMYKALYASASVPGGAATADAAAMSLAAAAAASLAKTEHLALPHGSNDAETASAQLAALNAELQELHERLHEANRGASALSVMRMERESIAQLRAALHSNNHVEAVATVAACFADWA